MRKHIQLSGLLCALLLSVGVEAAGLGRLTVHSSLGQPLRAEIELLAVSKEELGGVGVNLAGRETFRQARLERSEVLNDLRLSVGQRPGGQPVIRISGNTPIHDPFLDMLIELSWGSGRLLREYTILLDPPVGAKPAAAPPPTPVLPPTARAATPTAVPALPGPTPEMLRQRPRPAAAAPPPRADVQYGPVRSGETLRGIATKTVPEGITLEQMMLGIYNRNRDAFLHDNMGFLKKGAVLELPGHDDAMLVDPGRATREVRMHAANWRAYRQRLADAAVEAPAEAPAEGEAAAGRVVPKVEDQAAPPAPGGDVLRLSKGEPTGTAAAPGLERLQAMEEELAAKGRALREAQERVAQLEQTVRDMQRLLELKTQEEAEPPAAPPPVAEQPPAMEPPVEPPAQVMAQAPAQPEEQAKAVPPVLPAATPASTQSSWLSTFIGNPLYIGGIVAAVLLSFLLWMMVVGNRRRKGLNSFEDSIMTGGEFKKDAVFTTGTGTTVGATEGSMLLTDFSRLGLGAIDTHEVDPVAEAEVYMAYGRDAQAEEILKEALSKDPGRHELTVKLLEIYSSRKDPVSFETLASELYASLGGQPTEAWQKAAEMGRVLDPDNPLYRIASVETATPAKSFTDVSAEEDRGAPDAAEDISWIAAVERAETQDTEGPELEDEATAEGEAHTVAGFSHVDFDTFAEEPVQPEAEAPVEEAPQEAEEADEMADLYHIATEPESFEPVEEELPEEAGTAEETAAGEEAVEEEIPLPDVEELAETPPSAEPQETFGPEDLDVLLEGQEEAGAASAELPEEIVGAEEVERVPGAEISAPAPEMAEAVPSAQEAEAGMPDLDFSGIDLDLEEPSPQAAPIEVAEPQVEEVVAEPLAQPAREVDPEIWEETNTKLDLARAYLDMGDSEGAREILQEVLTDGDEQQQETARKLLDETD